MKKSPKSPNFVTKNQIRERARVRMAVLEVVRDFAQQLREQREIRENIIVVVEIVVIVIFFIAIFTHLVEKPLDQNLFDSKIQQNVC